MHRFIEQKKLHAEIKIIQKRIRVIVISHILSSGKKLTYPILDRNTHVDHWTVNLLSLTTMPKCLSPSYTKITHVDSRCETGCYKLPNFIPSRPRTRGVTLLGNDVGRGVTLLELNAAVRILNFLDAGHVQCTEVTLITPEKPMHTAGLVTSCC